MVEQLTLDQKVESSSLSGFVKLMNCKERKHKEHRLGKCQKCNLR